MRAKSCQDDLWIKGNKRPEYLKTGPYSSIVLEKSPGFLFSGLLAQQYMHGLSDTIFYSIMFFSVYVQIFFLFTFFENKKKILGRPPVSRGTAFPSVTIIVPCFNEQRSIEKTMTSLLSLDYPKDKLEILVVDDGSTDKTWEIIQTYKNTPQVRIFHKENGGKFTALNYALERTTTEFFSCMDADSTVDSDALIKMMRYFEDAETMAVIPVAVVVTPTTFIQRAQKIEYYMSAFYKKIFSIIGGLYVTPGTLPIYRKAVVDRIGGFRHGHNGEDAEMAFRMQEHHMKIVQCHEVVVHTIPPATTKVLYKQRVRWVSAYLGNVVDYRKMIFSRKYGNFGMFTLPSAIIPMFAFLFIFSRGIYNFLDFLIQKFIKFRTVGFEVAAPHFDPFFFSANSILIIIALCYVMLLASMAIGMRMVDGKVKFSFDIVYYFAVYVLLQPFWLLNSFYNISTSRQTTWR